MRFEKRFPSLTLTLSRAKIDRCRLSERVDASSFSSSASLLASLTLTNPSWIYSKERVTNDPLRKFSRLLLPRILFSGLSIDTKKRGRDSVDSKFPGSGENERKGGYALCSLFWNLPRGDFLLVLPLSSRVHLAFIAAINAENILAVGCQPLGSAKSFAH